MNPLLTEQHAFWVEMLKVIVQLVATVMLALSHPPGSAPPKVVKDCKEL
jgi:hypothetical protein